MRLRYWCAALGLLIALGCLQVLQRTAVVMKGYAVGAQVGEIHQRRIEVSWLEGDVVELSSPTRLAAEASRRKLKLVAWSALDDAPQLVDDGLVRVASASASSE